jgi:NADPH-dependent 2,4-dienoyl-CoA reductase/sulfur reductase-like enzyme
MVVRGMPHQRIRFIGMFVDARKLPAGATVEADICIIGGGAAGITLACDLAGSNLTVALLEGGGLAFEEASPELLAMTR